MRILASSAFFSAGLATLAFWMPAAASAQTMDDHKYLFVMVDELEQAPGLGGNPILFSGEAWYGGDYSRIWIKVAGDAATSEREGAVTLQALLSRLVSPWWELQAGVRVDRGWGDDGRTRPHAVLGIQGLAPYWFETEAALFVDPEGKVSLGVDASYDLLLTQSLILEPSAAIGVALQDVPEWGISSGLHEVEAGARLRYEVVREFAPYVGVTWHAAFGGTAQTIRNGGGSPRQTSLVAGLRVWY